ncbi:MAG TPA: hypothetical protein VM183_13645 [Burkholderiales bacterium]|nr:hypothetical protein [Burkholderiales bacterium]
MQVTRLERHPGYLAVHCSAAAQRELSQLYRDLAVECLETQVKCVLLDALDSDPENHHGLRDALTTMVLAGIPPGFRLALVTNVPSLQRMFAFLVRDLEILDIPTRLFEEKSAAVEWLSSSAGAQPAQPRRTAESRA